MDTIFENRTNMTGETLAEFSKKTYKVYGKKYRSFLMIMFLLCIVCVILGLTETYMYWFSACMLLLSAFFCFMFFKGYTIKAKLNQKNMRGIYGENPQITYTFLEDNFLRDTEHSHLDVNYSQITKIIESENLYILMIVKQGLILKKDSFTIGNSDDFKSFIKNKCANAQ